MGRPEARTLLTAAFCVKEVIGHAFQTKPIARQYLHTSEFNTGQYGTIEKHADAYNGGGPAVVKERQLERTDPDVLAKYGGGDVWPMAAAWDLGEVLPNGNYLENDDLAVSHGVCGDTPQSGDDNEIVYSTPTSEWDVLEDYEPGAIIEIDVIITNYHWGHIEFFLCCTADLDDPDGVPVQSCFNKYPLDRADDDSYNSPVDTNYPGRYFIDPPCRGENEEVDQSRPELEGVLMDGTVNHMRYKLPEITCDHAILMMRYHSGAGCRSPGYEEFNPSSWPSECAPDKEDWIALGSHECNSPGREWGNLFWNCADIALKSADGQVTTTDEQDTDTTPVTTTEPTPLPTPEPTPAPATPRPTPAPTPEPVEPQSTPAPTPEPVTPNPTTEPTSEPVSPQPTSEPTSETADVPEVLYSHVGCFSDDREDRVLGYLETSPDMSTSWCYTHCSSKKATYMATQFGYECWCSQEADLDYARHNDDDESGENAFGVCDEGCYGKPYETCGGHDAFDLYKITEPAEPDGPEYVGCFADDRDDRVLGNAIKYQDDMTQSVCRTYCEAFSAPFYATQFGNECWCGSSLREEDYKTNGTGSCLAPCAGDATVACGGWNAFSLFTYM